MSDQNCIFCKIVTKEIPCNLIAENDDFMAFHDINPKAPVHILVIPKNHIDSFHNVSGALMAEMTGFMHEIAEKVGIEKSGYRVITNIGDDGGQEVKHLHWHILGGAKLAWGHFADADAKDFF